MRRYFLTILTLFLITQIHASELGQIKGIVLDATNNQTLISANVLLNPGNRGTATDREGHFILSDIPPGQYTLTVKMMGYETFLLDNIQIQPGSTIQKRIFLKPTVLPSDGVNITADKWIEIPIYSNIAMKMDLPIDEIPVSVGVIPNKILHDQQAVVLSDALKNVSGVHVQNNFGNSDHFYIRGFESTSAGLILLDGLDEPDVSLYQFYSYGFYDLYNVEQVEALKGPAAFLYGGKTLSGAINLTTKQPVFRNFVDCDFTTGSYDTKRATMDLGLSRPNSKLAFRLNGLFAKSGDYREHARKESFGLNPTLKWRFHKAHTLTLYTEILHSKNGPDVGIPLYSMGDVWELPDISLKTNYQTPFDVFKQDKRRIHLDYQWQLSPTTSIRNRTSFSNLDGHVKLTILQMPFLDGANMWRVSRYLFVSDEKQQFLNNQTDFHYSFKTGSLNHQLIVGLDISHNKTESDRRTQPLEQLFYLNPQDPYSDYQELMPDNTPVSTNQHYTTLAPYLMLYAQLAPKLKLLLGGRYDTIDFHTNRQNTPFDYVSRSMTSNPTPVDKTFHAFNPSVGLVYQDSEALHLFLNTGKSFAMSPYVIEEPEESHQFEMGFKYRNANNHFQFSFSFYQLTKENMVIPVRSLKTGETLASQGTQRSEGFEFEMEAQPLPGSFLFFNYAYTDAEMMDYSAYYLAKTRTAELADFSGNMPAFVPSHLLNVWAMQAVGDGFELGLGVTYTGDQYVSVENDYQLKGYGLLNCMVQLTRGRFTLQIHWDNITQVQYFTKGIGAYTVVPAGSSVVRGSVQIHL